MFLTFNFLFSTADLKVRKCDLEATSASGAGPRPADIQSGIAESMDWEERVVSQAIWTLPPCPPRKLNKEESDISKLKELVIAYI